MKGHRLFVGALVLGYALLNMAVTGVQGAEVAPAPAAPALLPAGTMAPDGVGVTVGPTANAGAMDAGPWIDDSTIHPLKVGDRLPAHAVVRTGDGAPFDLNEAVARRPSILIFYRGGWCPFCNAHLRELQGSATKLKAMGYQILAISRDPPADLKKYAREQKFDYELLSDSTMVVANAFGLGYKVKPDYLERIHRDRGADVSVSADNSGDQLITPGAYIVDTRGVIRFAYVNKNYTVRIGQEKLLEAARRVLEQ